MGSRRGATTGTTADTGNGTGVLDMPEENYAPAADWRGRGPAPVGALQRGRISDDLGDDSGFGAHAEEKPYVPRRGSFSFRLRGLPRSVGGKVVLGLSVFGVFGAAALFVAGVRHYLLHEDRFVVTTSSEIQIAGNEHLTRAQILSVFGSDLERNIFKVPLADRRADLERLPWVAHATVMRLLPNQLRISITERTPVAFVRQGTQIGLVDSAGVLLDMPAESAGDPQYSFPVLTGLSASDALPVRTARMDVYQKFMKELGAGGSTVTQSLSEVDVSNPEDVKALIASGGLDLLVHFGDEDFLTRYKLFEQHLPEWKTQYPKLASADMRYGDQVVLEMQGGAAPPLSGADGSGDTPGAETPDPGHPAVKADAKTVSNKTTSQNRDVGHPKPGAAKSAVLKAKVAAALAAARKPVAAGAAQ